VSGWEAFAVYSWAEGALLVALAGVCAVALVLALRGRRGAALRSVSATLICLGLSGTAVVYLPFWALTIPRIDRVRGEQQEHVPLLRLLVAIILIALVAHLVLIAVSRTRHTPELTRRIALVSGAATCAMVLHLFWIVMIIPFAQDWWPPDWRRLDRLAPMRPCRGAMVWEIMHNRWGEPSVYGVGRIDDLWLRFADPRSGRPVRALSLTGSFRKEYLWLTLPEAKAFRVRVDDPALASCDGTWRRDPVAPAPWHKIGWQ
jgi:hypothetical protein